MASWRKLLAQMARDSKPIGYSYDDAVTVLRQLGFERADRGGSSHRKWRRKDPGRPAVIIGLVESGHGPIKKVYILDMIRILRENGLMDEAEG